MKAGDRFLTQFGANVRAIAKEEVLKAAQRLELENDPVFEALGGKRAICAAFCEHRRIDDIEAMLAAVQKIGSRHQTVIGVDVAP